MSAETPVAPGQFTRRRQQFRAWRGTRPFWAGLFVLIAGLPHRVLPLRTPPGGPPDAGDGHHRGRGFADHRRAAGRPGHQSVVPEARTGLRRSGGDPARPGVHPGVEPRRFPHRLPVRADRRGDGRVLGTGHTARPGSRAGSRLRPPEAPPRARSPHLPPTRATSPRTRTARARPPPGSRPSRRTTTGRASRTICTICQERARPTGRTGGTVPASTRFPPGAMWTLPA